MEVGTLLPGNDKNNVIVNYLLSYFFVFKLSGQYGYLKGYLMPRTNKLPKKINDYEFSVSKCRFIKDISLLFFLIQHIYKSPFRND